MITANALANMEQQIERGIELLKLCQELQSEKDGISRPQPGGFDRTKTLDTFAMDIETAITNMSSLYRLIPMLNELTAIGRRLEAKGKLSLEPMESYAEAVIKHVKAACS